MILVFELGGESECVQFGLLLPASVVLIIVIGFMAAYVVLPFVFIQRSHACGFVAFTILPVVDTLLDLAYLLMMQFSSFNIITSAWIFILLTPCCFLCSRLISKRTIGQYPIFPLPEWVKSKREDPDSVCNRWVLSYLYWLPFAIINGLIFHLPWLIVGMFLCSIKIFPINGVSNIWHRVWSGSKDFDQKDAHGISDQLLKGILYSAVLLESVPFIVIQVINNNSLGYSTNAFLAGICLGSSILNVILALYRIGYIKCYGNASFVKAPIDYFSFAWFGEEELEEDEESRRKAHRSGKKQAAGRSDEFGVEMMYNSDFAELPETEGDADLSAIDARLLKVKQKINGKLRAINSSSESDNLSSKQQFQAFNAEIRDQLAAFNASIRQEFAEQLKAIREGSTKEHKPRGDINENATLIERSGDNEGDDE